MLDDKGKSSVFGQIFVAVVIALLVGGTAPWWWKEVFPDSSPTQQPTARPPQPDPISPPADNSGEVTVSGCVVTIANPLVALMSEPSRFSQELVKVEPGEYSTLGYQIVEFAGSDQGWFQIEAEGRQGWIANDTWTISSKTNACQ